MNEQTRTSEVLDWTVGKFTNDDLEATEAIWFKDEDEVDGSACGPVGIATKDGRRIRAEREDGFPIWVSKPFARRLAKELGVPLEEW